MIKALCANREYNDNLKKYDKKDGMLAILLFAIIIIMYALLGILYKNNSFIKDNIKIIGCLFNLLLIIVTILFVKLRKQELETIGLKGRWKLIIILGGVLSLLKSINLT